jgi:hypothetical protein
MSQLQLVPMLIEIISILVANLLIYLAHIYSLKHLSQVYTHINYHNQWL